VGYTVEEMTERTFQEITHPDDLQEDLDNMKRLVAGEIREFTMEKRYYQKDDSVVWVNLTVSPTWAPGEEPLYHIAIVEDITDRKRAEQALRFTQFSVDRAADAVFWIERDARFSYVNETACQMLGYSREELTSMTVHDIDPDFPREAWASHWETLKTRGAMTFESQHRAKDGRVFPVEISIRLLEFEGREYNIAYARDITERKQAVELLRRAHDEMEEQVQERTADLARANETLQSEVVRRKRAQEETAVFRRFAEASEQGLGMADFDGTINYANATLCRFLGERNPAEAKGKNIRRYYRKEDLPALENTILPAVLGEGHRTVEMPLLSIDGALTPLIQSTFLIHDDQGKPFCFANVLTDIAERKRIEEEIRRHRDHLEELVGERTADVERANEDLRREIADRRRAEERFRLAAQVASDLIYEWDVHDDTLQWFGPLDESLGYGAGEIPRTIDGWVQLMHPEDVARLAEAVERHRTSTEPIYEEYRMQHRDGSWRYWIDRGTPILDKQRRPVKWVGACVDITERKRAEEELLLKNIVFESSMAANSTSDQHGIIQHVNPAFLEMWGYDAKNEVVGQPIPLFFANQEDATPILDALNNTGRWQGKFVARRKDGSVFTSEGRATVVRNERGELIGYQSANLDVTDREKAEEALRESEERFRSLFEEARDGILLADIETRQLSMANRSICEMMGYSKEEFEHLNAREIHPRTGLVYAMDQFEKLAREEIVVAVEVPMQRKDGSVFYTDVSSGVISLQGKRFLIGQFRDVTERKQTLDELARMQATLEAAIEQSPAGIIIADAPDVTIRVANSAALGIRGETRTQLTEIPVDLHPKNWQTYYPDGAPYNPEDLPLSRAVLNGEISHDVEVIIRRPDGEDRWVSANAAPVRNADGETVAGIVVFPDVTERKEAERQIRELNVGLERRVKQRTGQLQSANEELNAFAYSVSHDLRAPLRAMEGFANALLEDYEDRLDEEGREYCQHIVHSAERMDVLIHDLLAYSRLGRTELRMQTVNLEQAARDAIEQLDSEIERSNAIVTVEGVFPEIATHYSILVQVLANLVSNAVKFVAPDVTPAVRIWAEPREDAIRLWVEDNGIGIAAEYRDRIFRVFDRLHGIESYAGTGIGLAIVARAVGRLGGKCGVESSPGLGSRFWVEFNTKEEGSG